MPTVEQYITENSKRISHVKSLVKEKAEDLILIPDSQETPLSREKSWKDLEFSHPERTIRLGTMFSGIGAIEHALQRLKLKHRIIFAGDVDANCKKSYFANYDIKEEDWFEDARTFDARKYKGQIDLLVGGAPCQAFSMVGKRLGFEDARGTLFYEFARVIKETQSKVFIFENVKGLINHDKGRTWMVMQIPS